MHPYHVTQHHVHVLHTAQHVPRDRQAMLESLEATYPASAAALREASAASLTSNWRVMSVTVADGCDGVGILGAVCLPLASVPLSAPALREPESSPVTHL